MFFIVNTCRIKRGRKDFHSPFLFTFSLDSLRILMYTITSLLSRGANQKGSFMSKVTSMFRMSPGDAVWVRNGLESVLAFVQEASYDRGRLISLFVQPLTAFNSRVSVPVDGVLPAFSYIGGTPALTALYGALSASGGALPLTVTEGLADAWSCGGAVGDLVFVVTGIPKRDGPIEGIVGVMLTDSQNPPKVATGHDFGKEIALVYTLDKGRVMHATYQRIYTLAKGADREGHIAKSVNAVSADSGIEVPVVRTVL